MLQIGQSVASAVTTDEEDTNISQATAAASSIPTATAKVRDIFLFFCYCVLFQNWHLFTCCHFYCYVVIAPKAPFYSSSGRICRRESLLIQNIFEYE